MLQCPGCQQPLLVYEWEGIEIDACGDCGGIWLDEGELELLYQVEETAVDSLIDDLLVTKKTRTSSKRCIRCRAKLETIRLAEPDAEIDRCPLGHGFWFDEGELLTVIQSHEGMGNGVVAHFFRTLFQCKYSTTSGDQS